MKISKIYIITWIILLLCLLFSILFLNGSIKDSWQYDNKKHLIQEWKFIPSSLDINDWILIHPLRYNDADSIWCAIHYFDKKSWLKWYVYQDLIIDYGQKKIWFFLWMNNFMPNLCDDYYNNFLLENWFDYNNINPKLNVFNKNDLIYYPLTSWIDYQLDVCDQLYYIPIVEADFNTFILWTWWMYASDKNNIYIFWRHDITYSWWVIPNFSLLKNEEWIIEHPYYKLAWPEDLDEIFINQNNIDNKNCNESLPS